MSAGVRYRALQGIRFCAGWILTVIIGLSAACTRHYTPKEEGYFRIDPVPAEYQRVFLPFPFSAEFSSLTRIDFDTTARKENWLNVTYPVYHATVYCNYYSAEPGFLSRLTEESRGLVYRHAGHADEIGAFQYADSVNEVYATIFTLAGNSATPVQFTVTDSTKHFFRGALYFDARPNSDSLAPVTGYLLDDISHWIETWKWKD